MKSHKAQNSILDIIDLRQIEYYLFINDCSFEFIKIIGRKSYSVLHKRMFDKFSSVVYSEFLTELKQNKYLFGQPINIILNLSSTYTYIKQVKGSNLPEIQNSIKLLSDKKYDVKFSIQIIEKTKLFIYQAVKKEIINSLLKAIDEHNINCLQIITLQIALLSQTKFSTDKNSVHSYSFFNNNYHLIRDENGIVILHSLQTDIKALINSIFSGKDCKKRTYSDSPMILSKLHKKIIKKLSYLPKTAQQTLYLYTAQNSFKLLSRVALFIFLLLIITTVISSLLSSESEIISKYQQKYVEKQMIQKNINSLQATITKSKQDMPQIIQTASILSAFCQKSYNNLYLTKISINNRLDDSAIVEIKGFAKNEDLIFKYQKACKQYTQPFIFSLNSIKPEIKNNRGLVDTSISFTLSTKIDK